MSHTRHTVLAVVNSHKSGGRAVIVEGHEAVTIGSPVWTDPALKSHRFKDFQVGTLLVVIIFLRGRRRKITMIKEAPATVTNSASFKKEYESVLQLEKDVFEKKNGEFTAAPTVTPMTSTTTIPSTIDYSRIYIDDQDNKLFNVVRNISDKRHVAIMMIGPSGYGKSSIPQQKAEDWGMNFLRWDCATVRDPEEFFGFRGALDGSTMDDDGSTLFTPSKFTEAIEKGNVVVVLDELNRTDPYISNILFPLLDHAGTTSVAGHQITVGPNVIFVATVNIGHQFTGTFQLDTALSNRFMAKVVVGPLPNDVEIEVLKARTTLSKSVGGRIVKIMTSLREMNKAGTLSIDASTRVSLQISELCVNGLPLKESLMYTIVNGVNEDEAKQVIDRLKLVS